MAETIKRSHTEESGFIEPEELSELLRQRFESHSAATYFELRLSETKLLSKFEEAGIIPSLKNPNPYSLESEEAKNEQWWSDHPEAARKFTEDHKEREKAIKRLYVGVILGYLAGSNFFPTKK